MSKLKPIGDRVIVQRQKAGEKTTGGIILPDSAKNKPQLGTVLAVGPGKLLKNGQRRAPAVKEGETVIFTSWAGDEYKQQKTGENLLVMREEDILAVVD